MSVYLINAFQPGLAARSIQITRQKRNENQSAGEIEIFPFIHSAKDR